MSEDTLDSKPNNTMTEAKTTNNDSFVIVSRKEQGTSFLDRTDALPQQNQYRGYPFNDLRYIRDFTQSRMENTALDDATRLAARKNNADAWNEVNSRRKEAENTGLLTPIHNYLRPIETQYHTLEQQAGSGAVSVAEIQGFLSQLNSLDFQRISRSQVPQNLAQRLDGVAEDFFDSQLRMMRNRATRLMASRATSSQQNVQGGNQIADLSRAVREGTVGAMRELRLSSEDSYRVFQDTERWTSRPLTVDPSAAYWLPRTGESQGELHRRRELMSMRAEVAAVSNIKRDQGSLEAQSKVLGVITGSETSALGRMPGVEAAMKLYARTMKDADHPAFKLTDVRGTSITIRDAKDRDSQIELYRKKVTEVLMRSGLDQVAAIDAEQTAFNLLYAGNFFESKDSQWELVDGVYVCRRFVKMTANEFVSPAIKTAMSPLDAALNSLKKTPEKFKEVGSLGGWVRAQGMRALSEIGMTDFDNVQVVVIPYSEANRELCKDKWWTATKNQNGAVLYVPDFYSPITMTGSVWDETKIDGISLCQYLESNQPIPWDKIPSNMWADYATRLKAVDEKWKYLQGGEGTQLNAGVFGGFGGAIQKLSPWNSKISNALAGLGERGDNDIKRWIVYAGTGVDSTKRLPFATVHAGVKDRLDETLTQINYIPRGKVFFQWDQTSRLRKLFL